MGGGNALLRWHYTSRTDYAHSVTLIDGDTRQYVGRYTNNRNGTYTDILETSSNLIGKKIQGTTRCGVIAGMVSRVQKTNREGSSNVYSTTTIAANKTIEDQYWNVVVSTDDAESSEFSALRLVSSDLEAASPIEFTCEFVEGWSDTQQ